MITSKVRGKMPGDIIGWTCSVEIIVGSPSPLDDDPISPASVAAALTASLKGPKKAHTFRVRGARSDFTVQEAHVYRVAPTLTAIRSALKLRTPWARARRASGRGTRRRRT